MKTTILRLLVILLLVTITAQAQTQPDSATIRETQSFQSSFRRFSGSKPGYLILNSGERVDFTVKKIKRKKGLIKWVRVRSLKNKEKLKYRATDISEMLIVPSLFSKVGAFGDANESVLEVSKTDYTALKKLAHLYTEKVPNRNRNALYQVVNPDFDQNIRVYGDPRSKETSGVRVSGVKLTGGLDKSYYVKYKDRFMKVRKASYRKWYQEFFGGCPTLLAKYGRSGAWRDFSNHIYFYGKNCQ